MAPKTKFTREQIIAAALELVRNKGASGLTARELAGELGSSAKPIFGFFQSMEHLQQELLQAAGELYQSYIDKGMREGVYPPYKASGMAYIQFATEEKELFKLLFMRDRSGETTKEDGRESIKPLIELIMANIGLSEEDAYIFHMEQWVYVHGIATMIATGYLEWDLDFVSRALSDVYQGLKLRYTGGK